MQKELEKLIVNTYREENAEDEITLTTVYPMWLQYFQLHTLKSASVKRYSTEWSRFYERTKIATTPLKKFNKLMLDEWAHGMIKANHMTKKSILIQSERSLDMRMKEQLITIIVMTENVRKRLSVSWIVHWIRIITVKM